MLRITSLYMMDSIFNTSIRILAEELHTVKKLKCNKNTIFEEKEMRLKRRVFLWKKLLKKYEKDGSSEVKVTSLAQSFKDERGTVTSFTAANDKMCNRSQDISSKSNKTASNKSDTPSEENSYMCSTTSSLFSSLKCSASLKLDIPSEVFTKLRSFKKCRKDKFVGYFRRSLNEKSNFSRQCNDISSNSNKFIMPEHLLLEDENVRNDRLNHINEICEKSLANKKVLLNYNQNTCRKLENKKMKKVCLSETSHKSDVEENYPSDDEIFVVTKDSKKSNCSKNSISKFQNETNNRILVSDSAHDRSNHVNGICEKSLENKKVLLNYNQNTCRKMENKKVKKVCLSETSDKSDVEENNPSDDEIFVVSTDSKKYNCTKNSTSKFLNETNRILMSDSALEKCVIKKNISDYDTTFMPRKNGKISKVVESINCIFEKERTGQLRQSTSYSMSGIFQSRYEYEENSENIFEGPRKYEKKCNSIDKMCIDQGNNGKIMNLQQSCEYILSKKFNFQKELDSNIQITKYFGGVDDRQCKKERNCSSDTNSKLKSIKTKKLKYSDSMHGREFTLNSEEEKYKNKSNVTHGLKERDNIDAQYITVRTPTQNDKNKQKIRFKYSFLSRSK